MPTRSPALRAMSSIRAMVLSDGGCPSGAVACTTPIVFPEMLSGTHTAEHGPVGRSRRYGQASSAVLLGQIWVWPQGRGRAVPRRHDRATGPTVLVGRRR